MAKNSWVQNVRHDPMIVTIAPDAGDFLIAWCISDSSSDIVGAVPGWTNLGIVHSSYDGSSFSAWWKIADGTETNFTAHLNSIGGVLSEGGIDQTNPLDVAAVLQATSSGATTYNTSITPVTNGAIIVYVCAVDGPSGAATFAWSTVSGTTGAWTPVTAQNDGAFLNVGSGDCTQTTAGAITARCTNNQTGGHLAALFALRPGASPAPPPTGGVCLLRLASL